MYSLPGWILRPFVCLHGSKGAGFVAESETNQPGGEMPDIEFGTTHAEVVRSNIEVHSVMADRYHEEPHWRPENQQKVAQRLASLLPENRGRALDVGCGSGFLTTMLQPLFRSVDGLDATPAMMERVPDFSNVALTEGLAEDLPFPNDTFDMVCAYSFLHHLLEPSAALREMYRVLKPGGRIYVDLEPNQAFWKQMAWIHESNKVKSAGESPIVAREIQATLFVEQKVEADFGIEQDVFRIAEYSKSVTGGFDVGDLQDTLVAIGFVQSEVHLDWFMGQGDIMHRRSFSAADTILSFLQSIRPASDSLFKYVWFEGTK